MHAPLSCTFVTHTHACPPPQAAGQAFGVLFKGGSGNIMDSVIPSLLMSLEASPDKAAQALEGLRVILSVKPTTLNSMVPKLLKPPVSSGRVRALGSLAEVAGVCVCWGRGGRCVCVCVCVLWGGKGEGEWVCFWGEGEGVVVVVIMCSHINIHVHTLAHVHSLIYTHTHSHTYTLTHSYTHSLTRTQVLVFTPTLAL